ncbi:hypothetical protein [Mariniblastus fucicola]|uniref:Uncharacterized protein n=1 Tax=Mariniblastus fucicola TaxID=980251 RepID=A0A5B9PFN4_9BACT|nr:hypothetical protein [Mariniblastus fucicola]QEG25104.1 hypothetical protein MFFC18_50270 [Mariniblastus fucicola]
MPLSKSELEQVAKPTQTLQIIGGAMIMGVSVAGVMLSAVAGFAKLDTELSMLVAMAAMTGAVMYSIAFGAFKMLSSQTDSKSDDLMSNFKVLQTAWIVRFAIIEGACFLNLMVTLVEHSLITLFVAVFGVLLMVIGFPRTMKVEELLEERMK